MKTKQEFADAFADQMCGFLLSAFTQNEKADMTDKGRFMNLRLKEVRPLLDRMYQFITETEFAPIKSNAETLTEDFVKMFAGMAKESQEKCKDRLRAASLPVNGAAKK